MLKVIKWKYSRNNRVGNDGGKVTKMAKKEIYFQKIRWMLIFKGDGNI
jgi:hypothetical protein